MKNLQFLKDLNIYFVGIGGISMSGLAKLVRHFGALVSGSDNGNSPQLHLLRQLGININTSHSKENISSNIDIIVYSGAIKMDNPEIVQGNNLNIKMMERSEFLGEIAGCFERVIAISGTHGKTTTTAILGLIMQYAGLNPTIHLGGEGNNFHDNTIIGDEEYFLLEACEYRESFRFLMPYIGVITNIESDHLDYYGNIDNLRMAFTRFSGNCKRVISDKNAGISHHSLVTIGDDWQVKQIEYIGGGYSFNVYFHGKYYWTFRLNCLGLHNVTNTLFAISVAHELGIGKDVMERAVADFKGVERRYETIATIKSHCRIIIDYAHHPTELKASIEGLRGIYKKILYVFQPHTFSRTIALFDDFKEVLESVDDLIMFETYPAREEYIAGGSSRDLFECLSVKNKAYLDNLEELVKVIEVNAMTCDCVLVLGAGNLADKLKEYYM